MEWRDAVLAALLRYTQRHGVMVVERQAFIPEQLETIRADTGTQAKEADHSLNAELVKLRNAGMIAFLERGRYLLYPTREAEDEKIDNNTIDEALRDNRLHFVETDSVQAQVWQRRGQLRIRSLVLNAYNSRCAVCDVSDVNLLVASHIVGWAEAPEHRVDLTNVIFLCRFHDVLFEAHFWSLGADHRVLKFKDSPSQTVRLLLEAMTAFQKPVCFPPSEKFLHIHRSKCGST